MITVKKKNQYLYRNHFIENVDSKKICSKSMSIQEIKYLLQFLENEISNYIFEIGENFIMNSRRKVLKDNIMDRLNKSVQKLVDTDEKYRSKGIICEQEKTSNYGNNKYIKKTIVNHI